MVEEGRPFLFKRDLICCDLSSQHIQGELRVHFVGSVGNSKVCCVPKSDGKQHKMLQGRKSTHLSIEVLSKKPSLQKLSHL